MRNVRRSTPALILSAALLPGCACDTVPPDAVTKCQAEVVIGAAATDIVFVIDESGSMDEEQQNLQDNLSAFVMALANAPVRNDFRIGVTTTSVSAWDPAAPAVYASVPTRAPAALRMPPVPSSRSSATATAPPSRSRSGTTPPGGAARAG